MREPAGGRDPERPTGVERLDGPVVLLPYDPDWPEAFERLARRVRNALGDRVILLEHAGSTAVPGLTAKPVIDIVLAVADARDEADYVADLEAVDFWLALREPEWFETTPTPSQMWSLGSLRARTRRREARGVDLRCPASRVARVAWSAVFAWRRVRD